MLALQEGIEEALYFKGIIFQLYGRGADDNWPPVRVYVDNKSVTQAVYSTKLVDDKRLRLDVACVKDVLSRDILGVQLIPGQLQLANCMIKRGASC